AACECNVGIHPDRFLGLHFMIKRGLLKQPAVLNYAEVSQARNHMAKSKRKVFLDANVVIGAGKPPGGPELSRVIDLVEAELVTVLTTDLTITEVVKKHVQNDFEL